jgi:hypothetical protein
MTKHDYHWTFGHGVHISFPGGGAPVNQPNHAFSSNEGCAAFSDSNGNLLFYTDGRDLYGTASNVPINSQTLGGTSSSAHSAIIVPPAGGGSRYHILTTGDWDSGGNIGPLTHTSVAVGIGTPPPVTIVSGPTKLTGFGPQRAAEKLAAIPHVDCNKYWVVSLEVATGPGQQSGPGTFYSMLIHSDAGPTPGSNTVSQPYPYPVATHGYCTKFSPDGKLLAVASATSIDILNFDRSTGAVTAHSQIDQISDPNRPYGVEFSPNGLYLYFTGLDSGYINRHTIGLSQSPPTTPFSSTSQIAVWPTPGPPHNYKVGSLQLAPNGKIYGTKVGQTSLFEIGLPDSPTATAGGVGFNMVATTTGGAPLTLTAKPSLGLPTFTRIADDCADNCRNLAALVDEQIAQTPKVNTLRPCDKSQPVEKPPCAPLDLPRIAPWTSIRWGDSNCDCIEGDDTEVMHLTVCNPYRNLTLSNLTVHQLLVVDMNGNPPPLLPDGSPSIQLVPIGPYCFDDLAPCTCVTRQFVLRLRGAVPGPYRILVKGICFDACFHGDEQDCFIFNVCKD